MEIIKKIVAILPCWGEPLAMINETRDKLEKVKKELEVKGFYFQYFFLKDGAEELPEDSPILVRHKKNRGLALTLLDGYGAIFTQLQNEPDLIIRLDVQEHDPFKIMEIVDAFLHSPVQALFLPVRYWVKGEPRPLMAETLRKIADFIPALAPIQRERVLEVYNQEFPVGYQAFRSGALWQILDNLQTGGAIFERKFGQKPTWGLDLLAILLAANKFPSDIDFIFGGWAEPWLVNRGPEKLAAQKDKAAKMVEIALELGCSLKK